jgi:hypothetical protein
VVERHPVRHPGAAVVPGDVEAIEPERLHHRDAVARHRALGVRLVVLGRHRLGRPAVAAQVGDDDRAVLGQRGRRGVPHRARLRIAVQEQQRRAAAGDAHVDRDLPRVDVAGLEAVEDHEMP